MDSDEAAGEYPRHRQVSIGTKTDGSGREKRTDGSGDLGVPELRENIESGTIEDAEWVRDAIREADDPALLAEGLDLCRSGSDLAEFICARVAELHEESVQTGGTEGGPPDETDSALDLTATLDVELDSAALAADLRAIGDAFHIAADELEQDEIGCIQQLDGLTGGDDA